MAKALKTYEMTNLDIVSSMDNVINVLKDKKEPIYEEVDVVFEVKISFKDILEVDYNKRGIKDVNVFMDDINVVVEVLYIDT